MDGSQKNLHGDIVINAKPFLKWAGGKTQLINEIKNRFPEDIIKSKKIENYCEPFIGGGALFFDLMSYFDVKESYISDINSELILVYKTIQKDYKKLIEELFYIKDQFYSSNDRKEFYLNIRKNFNESIPYFDYEKYSSDEYVTRSSWMIFMNKTCFNGLFRLNKKGEFNVPFGKYKNPKIFDQNNIKSCALALKDTKIVCNSFLFSKNFINSNSLVYLDPPYRPISNSSNFTSYSKFGFDDDDQRDLADYYGDITKIGAKAILSNSYCEDGFFDELYGNFNINLVKAKRSINRDGKKRGNVKEILVTNY